jgi:hypothetical protein
MLDSYHEGLREYFLSEVPEAMVGIGVDERTVAVVEAKAWHVFGVGRVTVYSNGSRRSFGSGKTFTLEDPGLMSSSMRLSGRPPDAPLSRLLGELPSDAAPVGLLSSDEFTTKVEPFGADLVELAGPRVAILLSGDPDGSVRQAPMAEAHYSELGARPHILGVFSREEATSDALADYDLLFVGGGDPARLLACLRGTPLWAEVLRRWAIGYPIAGSSAGAMALCRSCLVPEPGADAPTRWTPGLGPLERFGLAVHAASRPAGWLDMVTETAPVPVVALDDATGIILRPGLEPIVVGPGSARLVTEPQRMSPGRGGARPATRF